MLVSTKGIVLKTVKYSEASIVAKIYTEKQGLLSFLVNGVHSRKGRSKAAVFQVLSLVDLVIYYKQKEGLLRIREAAIDLPLTTLHYQVPKSAMAIFMAEVLSKSIKEEGAGNDLYRFLHDSITFLDTAPNAPPNFHLLFLIELTRFLGFYPLGNCSVKTPWFDLREGEYVEKLPDHQDFLDKTEALDLWKISGMDFVALPGFQNSRINRRLLLEKLLLYFNIHIPGFGASKSFYVLQEVLG